MAEIDTTDELLAQPKGAKRRRSKDRQPGDRLGRGMEALARGMGTPAFLIILTLFVAAWILWNSFAPETLRFDSAALGFIALTLALSLQASYAAPMLLLAQNRQDDRDRVQIEQDRQRAERNTADLEYLTREIVSLRMQLKDLASRDFIRAELRSLLDDIEELGDDDDDQTQPAPEDPAPHRTAAQKREQARMLLERRAARRLHQPDDSDGGGRSHE